MSTIRDTAVNGHRSHQVDINGTRLALFNRDVVPLIDELRRAALRLTRHDADDLLQATLEKAWRGMDSFQEGTNIRAWLHRIMANTWISMCRTAQRRPVERPLEEGALDQLSSQSAEAEVINNQPHARLGEAMRALPEPQRIVIYYAFVEGRHYDEIANILGIPVGTVMSRVFRARRALRTDLAGQDMSSRHGMSTRREAA